MQKDHKLFEDVARMASAAGGTFMEIKREMESMVSAKVEKLLHRMDLVTREDFNLVREMAIKARTEQEKLITRVEELEKELKTARNGEEKTTAKKASPKKTDAE